MFKSIDSFKVCIMFLGYSTTKLWVFKEQSSGFTSFPKCITFLSTFSQIMQKLFWIAAKSHETLILMELLLCM